MSAEITLSGISRTLHPQGGRPFTLQIPELEIKKREFYGLLGKSGCGKSTLLRVIAGLLKPDSGDIFMDGKRITHLPPPKRSLSMVFQKDLLFPHMRILENITFPLRMHNLPKAEREAKAFGLMEQMGLQEHAYKYPEHLSGGQRQRVSLIRAIISEPEVLLMDEPFSALDSDIRSGMRAMIRELHARNNMTILFVTHDLQEAFELFSTMSLMENGAILQGGTPQALYDTPKDAFCARFMGRRNILDPDAIEILTGIKPDSPMPFDSFRILMQRPENTSCHEARIKSIRHSQNQIHLTLLCKGIMLGHTLYRTPDVSTLSEEQTVYLEPISKIGVADRSRRQG